MAIDLSRVKEREGLSPRREPYWQRIRPGCFLGYRPSAREGAGTWIARAYDDEGRNYRRKALGSFGALPPRDRFADAKLEAEAFAEVVECGGEAKTSIQTVEQACREYVKNNSEAEGRFRRHVYTDAIAKLKLAKLRRHHLKAWRDRLEAKPALVSRSKEGPERTRPRSPSSINRDMAMLRAALNRVLAQGAPDTEAAWQEALRPIKNADRQRTLYLDRAQRSALVAALPADAAPFVGALCRLPLRPGAVASFTAGDFDKRTAELTIGKDKNGKPRRIVLPPATAAFLAEHTKDKLPSAALFTRSNGKAWDKETWNDPIAEAASKVKLPSGVTAYTLRHSTITDLVMAGLPLLSVAQISGTSAEMIERHYGHLNREQAAEALAGLTI